MEKRKYHYDVSGDAESAEDEPSKRARQHGDGHVIKNIKFGRVDPTFGQRSAIPGLDDYGGEYPIDGDGEDTELDYENSIDALSYLRAVRAEAFNIPSLLVASKFQADSSSSPSRTTYEDGIGDFRGWYEDGAYTAMPTEPASLPSIDSPVSASTGRDPQLVYFEAILKRFKGLRQRLSVDPPRYAVERLDRQHVSCMPDSTSDWGAWKWRLGNTEPEAAQVARMQKVTVLCLLRIMLKFLSGGGKTVPRRTSRWIWSLLARLPVSGELGSEEVAVVRDLGKKAVLIGLGLRGMDTQALNGRGDEDTTEEEVVDVEIQVEESGAEDSDSEDPLVIGTALPSVYHITESSRSHTADQETIPSHGLDSDPSAYALAAAREGLLSRLQYSGLEEHPPPEEPHEEVFHPQKDEQGQESFNKDQADDKDKTEAEDIDDIHNTRVTIDMILTIAGELYGQRDLLEFREAWD